MDPAGSRCSKDKPIHHYMGTLDFRQLHGGAGDRVGEGARGRAVRQDLLYRLRRDHRHWRRDQHSPRSSRLDNVRGVRPGRHRPQRSSRALRIAGAM